MEARRDVDPLSSSTTVDQSEVELQVEALPTEDDCFDLFSGDPYDYYRLGVPLYRAALDGDWKTANEILQQNPHLIRARIGKWKETVLHIAAAANRHVFVNQLVERMETDDLALRNQHGNTALHLAALSGNVESARTMINKNANLPYLRDTAERLPVYIAVILHHHDLAFYLMSVTDFDCMTELERFEVLVAAINSELYEIQNDECKDFVDVVDLEGGENKLAEADTVVVLWSWGHGRWQIQQCN